MKPPHKIYAKVEVQNGEEVLRMSTSPFLKGNIEYHLASPANYLKSYQSFKNQLQVFYTLAEEALPETDSVGKCHRRLITIRINERNMIERRYAWYSIAGFFSSPDCYAEHEIKNVIAWKYDD